MSTFGSALWGGGGGTGLTPTVGVPLSTLVLPAYRIAGITLRQMVQPSTDMYAEAIPELNRMIGSWNCERPKIFTVRIDGFDLTGNKAFLVGTGATAQTINGVDYGAFDMPRPQAIQQGVIGLGAVGSNGLVRMHPMYQMNDSEWARVRLQDIPGAVPLGFYFDGSYDTVTGYGVIYLWPQSGGAYSVEWYTWQQIPTFVSKDDNVALPPGYEEAIVFNLAKRLAALNPTMANMDPRSDLIARESLAAIENKNRTAPKTHTDFPGGSPGRGHFDWRSGMVVR